MIVQFRLLTSGVYKDDVGYWVIHKHEPPISMYFGA